VLLQVSKISGCRNSITFQQMWVYLVGMTFSSAKNKDDVIQAQPKSSMGPGVLTVRELAGTCGASDDSLWPDQGTEAVRILG
jgi:hypothetical protein